MRIVVEHVLGAHSYMRTKAPPEPWQPVADDETFFGLLGEMIVLGLTSGSELSDLTLSFANVRVEPSAADPIPVGDHVAVTIRGPGDWAPERTWHAGQPPSSPSFFTRGSRGRSNSCRHGFRLRAADGSR
jgi:hypothetical protein